MALLVIGRIISHYQISEKLGEGGMGEVYLATDTKLKREVALKVLPESFTSDPQRMARFTREAQVLASLNHPNIGAIHGLEEEAGVRALVLELIPGETLEERIARGALPLEEALRLAVQVAEALEAAHEKGVIHRDLKPANVKITPGGQVKVLDFGLAKAVEGENSSAELNNSPTLTMQATQAGIILGTAAYMSPEQARGRPTDRRTDIWAFGAVLFEMLSGKRAFSGEDLSMVLASVLKQDLDWHQLPSGTPQRIRELLERCLTPELRNRFQAIGDVRFELEKFLDRPETEEALQPLTPASASGWQWLLPWGLAGLMALALAVAVWNPWAASVTPEVTRLSLSVPLELVSQEGFFSAFSPDGKMVVFAPANREGIYLQRLDQPGLQLLPETKGARNPFFSPDGEWIAFFVSGELKKVSVDGGTPQTIYRIGIESPSGGAWSADGTIVFSTAASGLFRVSAVGGEAEIVTELEADEFGHRWPFFLPGGKTVLMTRRTIGSFDETRIEAVNLSDGQRRVLVEDGAYYGRFSPTGHLLFMREATLFAVPFDPESLTVSGTALPVLQRVMGTPSNLGAAQYAFSQNGHFIYRSTTAAASSRIVRMNRKGEITQIGEVGTGYRDLRLSPDGRSLAVTISDGDQTDIWIDDLQRGTRSRLTHDRSDDSVPVWTPDGERIIFGSLRSGNLQLHQKRLDSIGQVLQLTKEGAERSLAFINPEASAVTADGRFLLYNARKSESNHDMLSLPLDQESAAQTLFATEFREDSPVLSPNGRWLAYRSNETGSREVYLRTFPEGSGKRKISSGTSSFPIWSQDSQQLFYYSYSDATVYSVSNQGDGSIFQPGPEEPVFSNVRLGREVDWRRSWDLSPDGQTIYFLQPEETADNSEVILVLNWFEELKQLGQ